MQRLILTLENYSVAIAPAALHQMAAYRQYRSNSREACGVLLGYEWNQAAEIIVATPPQKFDSRSRYGYARDVDGHIGIAMEIWKQSGGTIGYLGEWHTHPERVPHPSNKDFNEANKIGQKNKSPVISLILGTTHGCGFVTFLDGVSRVQRFAIPRSKPISNWLIRRSQASLLKIFDPNIIAP